MKEKVNRNHNNKINLEKGKNVRFLPFIFTIEEKGIHSYNLD
jgi:hypothetical protein